MKEKRFYLIYKITNNLNQKFYIGKHETDNLDDDYFGSGKYLRNAQNKYGLENFTKTILFYCANREEMNLLEHCVVTPEFCQRKDVYNINEGGDGGWHHVNNDLHLNGNKMFMKNKSREEQFQIASKGGKQAKKNRELYSKEQLEAFHEMRSRIAYRGFSQSFKGKHHSEETKRKIGKANAIKLIGNANGMYGKMWICNDLTKESKSILKTDSIPNGWRKGRICKH